MDFNLLWQAALIVLVGTILLRIAGRKTVSEMTLAQTTIMISFGTLIIQPVVSKNIWMTFIVATILVLSLIVLEYIQVRSEALEKIITGRSKILIENGKINEANLVKVRMTVDQLEMNLRQKNVTKINDVEWATLEPSGQLGFTLKQEAQAVTKKEFYELQQSINMLLQMQGITNQSNQQRNNQNEIDKQHEQNIFKEIKNDGHKYNPPEHLQ